MGLRVLDHSPVDFISDGASEEGEFTARETGKASNRTSGEGRNIGSAAAASALELSQGALSFGARIAGIRSWIGLIRLWGATVMIAAVRSRIPSVPFRYFSSTAKVNCPPPWLNLLKPIIRMRHNKLCCAAPPGRGKMPPFRATDGEFSPAVAFSFGSLAPRGEAFAGGSGRLPCGAILPLVTWGRRRARMPRPSSSLGRTDGRSSFAATAGSASASRAAPRPMAAGRSRPTARGASSGSSITSPASWPTPRR
jgi:hypothetical protein